MKLIGLLLTAAGGALVLTGANPGIAALPTGSTAAAPTLSAEQEKNILRSEKPTVKVFTPAQEKTVLRSEKPAKVIEEVKPAPKPVAPKAPVVQVPVAPAAKALPVPPAPKPAVPSAPKPVVPKAVAPAVLWNNKTCAAYANSIRPAAAGSARIICASPGTGGLGIYDGMTDNWFNNTSADETITISSGLSRDYTKFILWHESGHVWLASHSGSLSALEAMYGRSADSGYYENQPQEIFAQSFAVCNLGQPPAVMAGYRLMSCSNVQKIIKAGS